MIDAKFLEINLKEKAYIDDVTYYHSKSPIDNLFYKNLISSSNIILNRKDIRVLTYNIFLRPPGIKNNESDHKDDRLKDFIKIIHNYDIICLQELFGSLNSRKEKLIKAAVNNGFLFFVQDNEPSYFSKYCSDGGILILSRFPIVTQASHAFSYGVGSDAIAQKGVIYAKISIGDSYLHIFNTHTQASYINEDYDFFLLSYNTRLQQLKEISEFINSILKTEYNESEDIALLCGDLNVDSLKYHKINIANDNICNSINNEYNRMMSLFKMNDLLLNNIYYDHHGKFPVTYGEVCSLTGYSDSVLTHKEDVGVMQNLDYIFQIQPIFTNDSKRSENIELSYKNVNLSKSIIIKDKSAIVEKLLISDLGLDKSKRQFSQLSDHYGISISLLANDEDTLYDNNESSMSNTILNVTDYSSS